MSWRRIGVWGPIAALAVLVAGAIALSLPGQACATTTPCRTLPDSPLVGVVVSVDTPSLGKVNGFNLRLADGSTVTLKVGVLENPTQFSPSHLLAHEATSVPIRAFYRLDNGTPAVYRLEDANPAAS
ncbi:MAG TPA: hypothetical protein VE011_04725 [Candidatus Dormibacteraeota bacterium]|nr:hypothetical protein [Candidatus Dormibacteraeota bacterium]